jgi:HEAT repeat protein
VLLEALAKSKDDYTGSVAAAALGKLRDPRAFEALIHALNRASHQISTAAACALAKSRDTRAVAPIVEALLRDDSTEYYAYALGELGDGRAVDPLIAGLGGKQGHVRRAAAEALSKLGEPRWVEWVRGDDSDFQRLAGCDDPRVALALIPCLLAPRRPYQVRRAAAAGLLRMSSRPHSAMVAQWQTIHSAITRPHEDIPETCSSFHHDEGIGLDFPVTPPSSEPQQAIDPRDDF